MTSSYWNIVSL